MKVGLEAVIIHDMCGHHGGFDVGSDCGDFWAQFVEILVFASPTSYMLTSFAFALLDWGIFHRFL